MVCHLWKIVLEISNSFQALAFFYPQAFAKGASSGVKIVISKS